MALDPVFVVLSVSLAAFAVHVVPSPLLACHPRSSRQGWLMAAVLRFRFRCSPRSRSVGAGALAVALVGSQAG